MPHTNGKFTAHEKTAILREHLIEGVPVSTICEKYGMSPSTIYQWRNKLLEKAPLTFGADSIQEKNEGSANKHIDNEKPYTNWADVPSPLPPDFDVRRLPPLIPVEIQELMAAVAEPYDPDSEEWQNAIIKWADPYHHRLKVTLPEPYLKHPEAELNDLGLPDKEFYTTGNLCGLLNLHPDTFRYRLRKGIYPEPEKRAGDKRRFSYEEVLEMVKITKKMPTTKYSPMGKAHGVKQIF